MNRESACACRAEGSERGTAREHLHIQCGDSSAAALKASGVPGEVLVWREIYIEGPVPGAVADDEWRRTRAEFFTSFGVSFNGALAGINQRYRRLEQAAAYDEVILWFDACMFDQTIMAHVIELASRLELPDTRLSLICISDRGLGEVPVDELPALFDTRHEITIAEKELAQCAWAAFTSENPQDIERLLRQDCSALPFLADALARHLQQFPSTADGLSRLQRQVLQAVAGGQSKLGAIFMQVSSMEEQAFLGDTSLWSCMDDMATCTVPLLEIRGPGSIRRPIDDPLTGIDRWTVQITAAGRKVLEKRADHVRLNGIDTWRGGVHLRGADAQWRWDEARGELVQW